jgi:hypothetical protein
MPHGCFTSLCKKIVVRVCEHALIAVAIVGMVGDANGPGVTRTFGTDVVDNSGMLKIRDGG